MEKQSNVSIREVFKSFQFWPDLFRLLIKVHPKYFSFICLLTLVNGFWPAASILSLQSLINAIDKPDHLNSILIYFFFFIGIQFLSNLLGTILEANKNLYQQNLANYIQVEIMNKAQRLPYQYFECSDTYDKLQRARQESTYRPYQIFDQMISIMRSAVVLISVSSVIVSWKWWLAVILILLPFNVAGSILRMGKRMFLLKYNRAEEMRKQYYFSHLLTSDINAKEIKLFHLGKFLVQRYREFFEKFYKQDKQVIYDRMKIDIFFQVLSTITIIFLQFLVIKDALALLIPLGSVIAYFQAITMTQKVSTELMYSVFNMHQNNLYLSQLFGYFLIQESEVPLKGLEIEQRKKEKGLRFENVSFKYPGTENYALKNVSFTIRAGEILALVGENGSGKTSLVKLLTSLYDTYEGEIYWDGVSMRHYDQEEWRKRISVMFQDFIKFELSVQENIGYGDSNQWDNLDQVKKASEKSGAIALVNSLPDQFETQLGKTFSNGLQLSGGQWQMLALSRAYMKPADLYIFDEPTSALDPIAEIEVFKRMKREIEGKMGIFISHRFSTVQYATKIITLEKGKIVEMGTHEELLALQSIYAKLYHLQAKSYQDK